MLFYNQSAIDEYYDNVAAEHVSGGCRHSRDNSWQSWHVTGIRHTEHLLRLVIITLCVVTEQSTRQNTFLIAIIMTCPPSNQQLQSIVEYKHISSKDALWTPYYQSLCQMQNFKLTFNLNVSIICQNSIIKEATKCNNSDLDTQEFFIVES